MSKFKPFIPSSEKLAELTLGPILMGVFLGILFGASSLYLALKVGMTVSASIPVAVLSITLFKSISKMFGLRKATILENNMVQTTGSAGESIAFGVAVTMPALLILGYDMDLSRIMTVSILGGLLGVLLMIPLRQSIFPDDSSSASVVNTIADGVSKANQCYQLFLDKTGSRNTDLKINSSINRREKYCD
jgi:putative OPT family oligopeptide transporter